MVHAPFVRLPILSVCLAVWALGVSPARAQSQNGFDTSTQWTIEQLGKNHVKLTGAVEAQRGNMRLFADEIESWTDTNRVVATGNVVFSEDGAQISADRADFNTRTRLGTFFNASGTATMADGPKKDMLGGQEPDVLFYGEQIEKIGPKKYRITHGGFTTCLQPTPRWEITSGTVTLNLEHYAFLTNAVLKAKSVPVLYLPVLYYPINKEDRATGFLMPVYGTSTYRGFTLSNAFFWAINRSQDATFLHDWFSKRGQGMGAEYRYVLGRGSTGNFRFYRLKEHESTDSEGNVEAGQKSYEVRGNASYGLGGGWSARGRVDYFTSVTAQQLYYTDIYSASRSSRSYSGSVSGSLAGLSTNISYDRRDYFSGTSSSAATTTTGGTPRVTLTRTERPLFGQLVYYTVNSEAVKLTRKYEKNDIVTDSGLTRLELSPTLRVPFTSIAWLKVNSTVAWHDTYWTRSLDPALDDAIVDRSVSRRYFDLQSTITGPTFNRVWNTPDNGYAEKWKHTIEPTVTVQRVTDIDNYDEIVKLEGLDYTVGGTTKIDYGINNRLLVKRQGPKGAEGTQPDAQPTTQGNVEMDEDEDELPRGGSVTGQGAAGGRGAGSSREIMSLSVRQTYYSNSTASRYDYGYSTSFSNLSASKFSAIKAALNVSPAERVTGSLRAEYNKSKGGLLSLSGSSQVAVSDWLNLNLGYSSRKVTSTLLTQAYTRDNYLNGVITMKTSSNRVGGLYNFNYDIGDSRFLNSRFVAYYNAQCCGFSVEYQTYNYTTAVQDRRFNFSFTLAGLGTFSNFFGALGGM